MVSPNFISALAISVLIKLVYYQSQIMHQSHFVDLRKFSVISELYSDIKTVSEQKSTPETDAVILNVYDLPLWCE